MKLNSRLEKLEQQCSSKALVACPYLLDDEGNRFPQSPQDKEIAAVRFLCNGSRLFVSRASNESLMEMESRASQAAKEAFDCVVVLPFYMEWV